MNTNRQMQRAQELAAAEAVRALEALQRDVEQALRNAKEGRFNGTTLAAQAGAADAAAATAHTLTRVVEALED